ncbi:hypothetical protein HWV62_10361 [Athelia sp. TMB]|nr:hypothetical protein HWV62_10361 [Athelia sp. TMB]
MEPWHYRLEMTVDDVWNAFFLHSLLLDHAEHETILQLDHNAPSHLKRLEPALRARNLRMKGTGQEEWNHACDSCSWHFTDEDGIEIVGCSEGVETGFKTCKSKEHRIIETRYCERGQAMFQLKKRLERIKATQTTNSMSLGREDHPEGDVNGLAGLEGVGDEDEEVVLDATGDICDGKPDTGNRMLRAKFGRTRSHNEELCVASCGVIRGRARFFGSEAPNGVRWFIILLYPTKESLPSVIWHDNNCRVTAMLRNDIDEHLRTYFDGVAMPVDVFHFKSKHKESDLDCGRHCNPYIWPELRTEEGRWRFNSSAAEQTNAWYGGFLAIVRDMQADRYEFFLDEMIKRRNRVIVGELRRKGKNPYNIPREDLLPEDTHYLI